MNHDWSILYVEDDDDDFYLVREMLSKTHGYRVKLTQANSYAEAENALSNYSYDAILVDVTLGDRSGIDLVRQYSAVYPAPFILYTGRGDYETDAEAIQAGGALYLTKDEVNPLSFERFIRNAIERKRLQQNLDASLRQKTAILESIQDGLYGLDRNFNFTYVNPRSAENINRSPEDMVGKNIWQEFPLLVGSPLEQNVRMVMSNRIPAKFEVQGNYTDQHFRISIYPSIEGVSVYWEDITGERQALEEARQAHLRAVWMARFPDENPNPVARTSLKGIVIYHNRAAADPEAWSFRMDEKAPPQFDPLITQVLREKKWLEKDVRIGQKFYSVSLIPFVDDGYINIYGRNITERVLAEQALAKSEERFSTAFENNPSAMVISRVGTGMIENINTAFEKLFGYQRQEVIGKISASLNLFADPEDRQRMIDRFRAEGTLRNYELDILNHSGEKRTVNLSIAMIDLLSEPAILTVMEDITERKRVEDKLHIQSSIFEILNEPVIITDLQSAIISWNPAAERAFGWKEAEVIGKTVRDVLHTEISDESRAVAIQHLQEGKPVFTELIQTTKDYRKLVVSGYTVPLHDMLRNLIGYAAVNQDITERRQAELALQMSLEQLHESELRFRTMADGTPVVIWVTDEAGKIEFINRAYTEFFGVTLEQIRSGSWEMLVHPEDQESYVSAYFDAARHRQPFRAQGRILRHDGAWRWIDSYGMPRFSKDGEYLGMAGSTMDITEQKRLDAEQREQAVQLEVQRRLIAYREGERDAIARDLHDGPIQTLSGALFQMQNILQDYPDPKLQSEIDSLRIIIRQSVQDLRDLMRDLRPPALLHFGLSKNILYLIEDYRTRYPKIEFELDLENDDQNTLSEAVRLSLFRIIQSGMSNIIYHSGATRIHTFFRVEEGKYCLELRDNGIGFDQSISLEQLSSSGHFGLIGMKERAQSIGAELQILSGVSGGTTIRVTGQTSGLPE